MRKYLTSLALALLIGFAAAAQPVVHTDVNNACIDFGLQQFQNQPEAPGLTLATDHALGEQAYRLRILTEHPAHWSVTGGDPAGIMYGLLELAEALRLGRRPKADGTPFIRRRGLKMNIPLDGRAPSYDDSGTSAIENIETVWDRAFWRDHLDAMARHRFNTLTFWHNHPFTSMIKLADYPDVALDDVMVPTYDIDDRELIQYRIAERTKDDDAVAANFKTVKRMTIDEKIDHWRWVMAYAKSRNIDCYFITWNIWTHGATGKYGITDDQTNPKTTAYFRESVKQFVLTYPDLAGLGLTLGEHFDKSKHGDVSPEVWGWETYGLGIKDAMSDPAFYANDPDRKLRFIHRVWYGGVDKIFEGFTRKYPGPVDLSFKYARARLYSTPAPPFFDNQLRAAAQAEGIATWMNLRNDDLFSLRWGDPDYVRKYIKNLPPEPELAGFHMGSDGYVWGRTFAEKREDGRLAPRRLEIDKHGYRFMMWGRLAYDPDLDRMDFEDHLTQRFGPSIDPGWLYDGWQSASKIVSLVNLVHWRDWDHMWSVETCMSKKDGYHDVNAFIEFGPLPGQGLTSIDAEVHNAGGDGRRPLDVADELDQLAESAKIGGYTEMLPTRTAHGSQTDDLKQTLRDLEASSHLGRYYADKLRGATKLHRFRVHGDPADQAAAVKHLEDALAHWDAYATNMASRYEIQLLARVSHTDWTGTLRDHAAADIAIARNAKHNVFPESVLGRTH